jgi:ribose 5-phosphate isomerase B
MMADESIWIGNDHGGYEMKLRLMDYLREKDIAATDIGAHTDEISRYPRYAAQIAKAVSEGACKRGILICSTGIGMSIAANRFANVRASLCTSAYMGKMTRAHNDSNILCLGGKITPPEEALAILEAWLATPFEGARHTISLNMLAEL